MSDERRRSAGDGQRFWCGRNPDHELRAQCRCSIRGPHFALFDFVEAGILPTVSFVQTEAVAIEPVPGEERHPTNCLF